MLIFTHSCILSVVVVVSTVMVIIVLSFFITVLMGWEVGLIEVIAFIYFIGRRNSVSCFYICFYTCREHVVPT